MVRVLGVDRAIATEDRVQWLRENGYRYVAVSGERTRHFDPEAALRIETASKHHVHLHKVLCDDGQEVRLYCFSEARAAKERGIVERFAQRFETALTELSEGLSKPRTHKRVDKVWQRIGRLKEKCRVIAQHYDCGIAPTILPTPGLRLGGIPTNGPRRRVSFSIW